ncbi:hypothetical protein HMPREF0026_01864 [Acinetobacter junii SH205]|uniref:Bacterial collagen-like protein middle domain-containing protein n=2 Tax=Acinetobacter junii TaxID=40215 RepID=D0SN04_ACIJU|nr:hypothetical protein [Acinetobacter junii]EEY92318.1 hypothetical protein HMPREF0026_01864 [Acinetobacter junii SH205]MCE6005495.1 hypothetical protein [Acinetobacter junii]RTE44851.1 hypothetical protein EJJ36_14600 [Acinetobacter junii]
MLKTLTPKYLLADNAINTIHQAENPISDAASLGTLTFETSRDTVNGSLETISDLAGADFDGTMDSATGVIDTLITNGSTATEIIQHIGEDLGNLGDLADGSPLEMVADAIEGFTGGDLGDNPVTGVIDTITGGTDGSPLEMVTDAIDGFTGGDLVDNPVTGVIGTITGGTDGSPLEMVTDAIEGFTGGDLGDNPVTGVIDTITGGTDGSPLEMITETVSEFTNTDESLSTITDLLGSITGDLNGGALGEITNLTNTISGSLNGDSLDPITGAIDGFCSDIGFDLNSESIILGVSEPTQTIISSGNSVIDSVQESSTAIFSDSTFESISSLISLSVESGDDCGCDGGVDSILTAITGSTSTLTSVTDTSTSTAPLTETVTPQTSLTNLSDNLFHSLSLF